jgi:hypothetical protein
MFSRRLLVLPACGAVAVLLFASHAATAQSATGTITGRVLWGNCIRGIPLPAQPNDQNGAAPASPAAPDAQMQPQPIIPQPVPQTGLPAGAVLVAVQSTAISARTDESGRFSLSSVPAGQYLTVAAGPVANATQAIAERPNVLVSGGQSVDIGTLSLGGAPTVGFPCRILPGPLGAAGADTTPPAPDQPPSGP